MATDRKSRLQEFVAWAPAHIKGDEKGKAQIFLDRLLQAFSQKGVSKPAKPNSASANPKKTAAAPPSPISFGSRYIIEISTLLILFNK